MVLMVLMLTMLVLIRGGGADGVDC